jgi:hypothetical protein
MSSPGGSKMAVYRIVRFTDAGKKHWQVDQTGAPTELPDRHDW